MVLNRDVGALRSSSHPGLRLLRRSTQTTVGDESVVNMLRGQVSVVTAVILRSKTIAADTGPLRLSQRLVPYGGAR